MRHVPVLCALVGLALAGCGSNPPATLEFVEVSPANPRIGDIATVRFRATDSRGQPMAGAQVSFTLADESQLGPKERPAVQLTPTLGLTNRGTGVVETQLVVNARVNSVVVVATAEGSKVARSPPISFAGTVPNARQFTFQCGSVSGAEPNGGVRSIIAYNETRDLIAGVRLSCSAHVGDRNGDGVPNALVTFMPEAGTVGPSSVSKSDGVGHAPILYKTSLPLPVEVEPTSFQWTPEVDATHTGEYVAPLWMEPFNWSQNPIQLGTPDRQEPRRTDPIINARLNNPRDNLVTMIAVTAGEEAFDDVNNNGKWDDGTRPEEGAKEDFVDTTEPFVDANDNGTWDPDERYVDTNNNGKWDGKNGLYDASTLIWVANRITWTGVPNIADFGGTRPTYRVVSPVTPPEISHFGSATFTIVMTDPWFNGLAFSGADRCGVTAASVVKSVPDTFFGGFKLHYPSPTRMVLTLTDVHDPTAEPPPPPFGAPIPWEAAIECQHSFSPLDPGQFTITYPRFSGTVL